MWCSDAPGQHCTGAHRRSFYTEPGTWQAVTDLRGEVAGGPNNGVQAVSGLPNQGLVPRSFKWAVGWPANVFVQQGDTNARWARQSKVSMHI